MFATSSFCQLLHPLFFISGQRKWNGWCVVVHGKLRGRLLYCCGVNLSRARSECGGWVGLSSAWLISVVLLFSAGQAGGSSYSFFSAQQAALLTSQTKWAWSAKGQRWAGEVHLPAPLLNWHAPTPHPPGEISETFSWKHAISKVALFHGITWLQSWAVVRWHFVGESDCWFTWQMLRGYRYKSPPPHFRCKIIFSGRLSEDAAQIVESILLCKRLKQAMLLNKKCHVLPWSLTEGYVWVLLRF